MARAKNNEMRKKILDTAYDLFLERGYDNVLMKEIAGACGITPTLLQHYYPKKEDLLVQIVYTFIFRTSEFLERHPHLFLREDEFYIEPLWTGMYYRLLYTLLCKDNLRLLRMYTGVLFNAPLLQRGLSLSIERLNLGNRLGVDFGTAASPKTYILNGVLAQMIALYMRDGVLIVEQETVVNIALRTYYRYCRLTRAQEREMFAILDEQLTPELQREYLRYCTNGMKDYVFLE